MNTRDYAQRIQAVLHHLETHWDQQPDLESLARIACFSPYHFHRIFTAVVGESVAAYRRRIALQYAAHALAYTHASVTEVALAAGYDSLEAFSRAFKARYGIAPSRCRCEDGAVSALTLATMAREPYFYHHNPEVCPVQVNIKTFPPVLTAAVRHIGPYNQCMPAWQKLCAALGPKNLFAPDAFAIGISYDDPDTTPADKLRMDCCVVLPQGVTAEHPAVQELVRKGTITLVTVGGDGEYAAVLIEGPYTLLHSAWRSLYVEWLPQSGREPDHAPGFEIYYNSPQNTAPEKLRTEIFVPLKPR